LTPLERIAIIGAGSIGTAWAVVFALAGCDVAIHDQDADRKAMARRELGERLADIGEFIGLPETSAALQARVTFHDALVDAVGSATYVQECIVEEAQAKRRLFEALVPLLGPDAIIASSSSFIPASTLAPSGDLARRCLVVHPGNPPYLLRVVEIVPSDQTDSSVVDRALALMHSVGMAPVLVRKEIEGFVFNRLQGAMLREAYALVRDGVVSATEIDRIVTDGLGLRWSVIGPFETADLNTRGGIAAHAERMLPAYRRMGAERGETVPAWPKETIDAVIDERRQTLRLDDWAKRVRWRDRELLALLADRAKRGRR
jgi:L-gulonate 3-dehydrogenase